MAYDLVDTIPIPEEYQDWPPMLLDGIAQSCKSICEPLIPFKTGYLLSCFDYELTDTDVIVFVDGCPYAVYLEEDIAKTCGWFSNVLSIFESAFLAALDNDFDTLNTVYEEASRMINSEQYGVVYKTKLAAGEVEDINMGRI